LTFALPILAEATKVWIDTDVSIGSPFREVDDAFALLLAIHSPNVEIAGISTSYGNASLRATTAAARDLLSKLDPRLEVHPGAETGNVFNRETEAGTALAATLRDKPRLTYVALGPLTNLATFQTIHPDLARRIDRVIFLGGTTPGTILRYGSRHAIRVHDANVVKDPAAVARVLRSEIPVTLVPVDTAQQLTVAATDLDAMRGSAPGNFIQARSRFWLWFWTKFVGTDGAPIFDAAAILTVTQPEQLALETRFATIDSQGNLIVSKSRQAGGRPVLAATTISDRAKAFVTQKLRAP
ncbi:MAG TPA: nucleoside hydrolase, partial [Chthoniobacterales bacterium]|nr:nucleoside hydrolase [Chthoniobacterales bacterium]